MDNLLGMLNALNDDPEIRETGAIRSPFSWPGGKGRSLDHILPELPYRSSYIEPFGGSGAVLLARNESKYEVFNDRFSGVTCFYRAIRDHHEALHERLQCIIHSREEFIWCKDTWKDVENIIERAARWYYMQQCCFAGQGRNFGRSLKKSNQISLKLRNNLRYFHPCHLRLRDVLIENTDWQVCFRDFDNPDSVFYIDPPYYKYFKGIYECEMTQDEHIELCERIFRLKGFVALSGYENQLYDKYPWDKTKTWMVRESMTGMAFSDTNNLQGQDHIQRGQAREVLYIKEAI